MKIYAYYTPHSSRDPLEEAACSVEWSKSWKANGWEPVMLNASHAAASGLYAKAQQKTARETLERSKASADKCIAGRLARLCALQAIGGGWMSDYDVVNLGFSPSDAEALQGKSLAGNRDEGAWIIYMSQSVVTAAVRNLIASELWVGDEFLPEGEILDFNDITDAVSGKLVHVKCEEDRLRSEVMRSLLKK